MKADTVRNLIAFHRRYPCVDLSRSYIL
jgi:hypothetical protein